MPSEKRTAHYIITRIFNNKFNAFIATGQQSKILGVFISGGNYDYADKAYNIFNSPASRLETIRDKFLRTYGDESTLSLNCVKIGLDDLLDLYSDVATYKKLNRKTRTLLDEQFFGPAKEFFNKMDGLYHTNYFLTKINSIPVNRQVVSDLEFAQQYFGKASGFGIRASKKEFEELKQSYERGDEKAKKVIEEFAKETYVQKNVEPEKEKKSDITLFLEVGGKSGRYDFAIERVQEPEMYTIGHFTTSSIGEKTISLLPGDYRVFIKHVKAELESDKQAFKVFGGEESRSLILNFELKKSPIQKLFYRILKFLRLKK